MILTLDKVSKVYDEKKVVDNVSFTLNKGEIVGFLGPNGAGKTTTMRMIAGIIKPSSGNIQIDNQPIDFSSTSFKMRMGYLPETNPLYSDMYVMEFLEFIGNMYRVKNVKDTIEKYVNLINLKKESFKKIKQLSKGYKQRVGLVAVMLHNPELLILDEPTSGLDPNQLVEIRTIIKKLGETKAVLFSSHNLSEVQSIAERIILIHQGKILLDSKINDINNQLKLQSKLLFKITEKVNIEDFRTIKHLFSDIKFENDTIVFTSENIHQLKKELLEMSYKKKWDVVSLLEQTQQLENIFNQLTQNNNVHYHEHLR